MCARRRTNQTKSLDVHLSEDKRVRDAAPPILRFRQLHMQIPMWHRESERVGSHAAKVFIPRQDNNVLVAELGLHCSISMPRQPYDVRKVVERIKKPVKGYVLIAAHRGARWKGIPENVSPPH